MQKLDYKKEYKDLYFPKKIVSTVHVPPIRFIAVKGRGLPGTPAFQNAISLLYSYTFSIKMSKMNNTQPEGYFEYVVPPLEALWGNQETDFRYQDKSTWIWTMMIRQPEFVTNEVFLQTRELLRKKKPELPVDKAMLIDYDKGDAIQIMHIGDYDSEIISANTLYTYMEEHHLKMNGCHHEIYLSDPRRTKPENLKTVIRLPIENSDI